MKNETFILLDTEYTSWKGSIERGWGRPDEFQELVQIGALKVKNLKIIEYLNILVKPKKNPTLSDYFVELTGITNKELCNKGIEFKEALKKLYKFCENYKIYSYGNDYDIIYKNLKLNNIEEDKYFIWGKKYNDIKYFFKSLNIDTSKYSSGTIYKIANINIKSKVHNALWDVKSILIAIIHLI